MTVTALDRDRAHALAALLATLRPDWDAKGVLAALGRAQDRGTAYDLAHAALRAAADLGNRTPAVIPLDGPHWHTQSAPTAQSPPTPTPPRLCQVCRNAACSWPAGAHVPTKRGDYQAGIAATRAAIRARKETSSA